MTGSILNERKVEAGYGHLKSRSVTPRANKALGTCRDGRGQTRRTSAHIVFAQTRGKVPNIFFSLLSFSVLSEGAGFSVRYAMNKKKKINMITSRWHITSDITLKKSGTRTRVRMAVYTLQRACFSHNIREIGAISNRNCTKGLSMRYAMIGKKALNMITSRWHSDTTLEKIRDTYTCTNDRCKGRVFLIILNNLAR